MSLEKEVYSADGKRHDAERLKELQNLPLDRKILLTQTRIIEWYHHWENKCYVSFSGGKDSTVCADITAQVCKLNNCKLVLWFSNTGLEYPEVVDHVKKFPDYLRSKYGIEVELIMDYPRDKNGKRIIFRDVIEKYGYPVISKEVSRRIYYVRKALARGDTSNWSLKRFNGEYNPQYSSAKYKYLIDAPFKISDYCCSIMKKLPDAKFRRKSGLKPILGTMACESRLRKTAWLLTGCNAFSGSHISSKPMSFWTEQDVLEYISNSNIQIPKIYGDIEFDKSGKLKTTGVDRTGCMFCMFGCHLEKEPNKFQQMKETHPKIYDYCMKSRQEGGLGLDEILKFINVKH